MGKRAKNGRKWAENVRKWTENGPKINQKMGRKWTKMDENGQKWQKMREGGGFTPSAIGGERCFEDL